MLGFRFVLPCGRCGRCGILSDAFFGPLAKNRRFTAKSSLSDSMLLEHLSINDHPYTCNTGLYCKSHVHFCVLLRAILGPLQTENSHTAVLIAVPVLCLINMDSTDKDGVPSCILLTTTYPKCKKIQFFGRCTCILLGNVFSKMIVFGFNMHF